MSNLKYNIEFIKKTLESLEGTFHGFDLNDVNRILEFPKQKLKGIKIKKFLGKGSYKLVFLLENGNVFSVFQTGHGVSGWAEIDRYKNIKDMLFSGTASKNDPIIYDFGALSTFDFNTSSYELFFVEMGYISSLKDWAEKNNISIYNVYEVLYHIFNTFSRKQGRHQWRGKNFREFISFPFSNKLFKEDFKKSKLTLDQYKLLMFAVWQIIKKHNLDKFPDLHDGNIGVIPNTVYSDKPIFVFFDF